MLNPNVFLMEHTLKSSFCVVIILVNDYGEEREISFKKKRKEFIKENEATSYRVILVDSCPPSDLKTNVYYVKKDGRIIWVKMNEQDFKG